ncbi:flavin monoamine oxidase family protein [Streptomyces johnsoniae]|uniref:NAD(P)/FAD-dependent oxidoreductase n=1 Tax=Streptomyces johnsoniae TaxID=3075532 RepID=A0ABU2SBU4_9ACTN|nr:NAD(P)/FAD-dependent oxidoreductase [Streptomyces sp. DSM 41886]MDT0446283.1 NAD(P)/FAD-dependent oxidoreductase [Streptomyces sp. DSM 41886]
MDRFDVTPTGRNGRATVAVLGAGISGLVAAYELQRLGHEVDVLEADERIGGRVFTHRFAGQDGPFAELGAMRIPVDHHLTLRYVDTLGLRGRLRPFRNVLSDPDNLLRVGGELVRVRNAAKPLIRYTEELAGGRSHRPEALLLVGWLHATVRALAPRELRELVRRDTGKLLAAAGRLDLTPYLKDDRPDLGAALRRHPELWRACSSRLQSFLDDLIRESGTGMCHLAGGMDQLTEGLAARLRRPVLTGHAISGIDVRRDEVRVRLGRRGRAVGYPVVLCTIPFAVLRHLPLTGVEADKLDVISTLDYSPATKVGVHCRRAFWADQGITGGGSAPGGRVRQTYYGTTGKDPSRGAALLGSYTIAEDADLLGRLPEPARHAAVLHELRDLHPEFGRPGMVRDVVSVAWGERPWHRGCAARRWGMSATALAREVERAARPQGRLFFAGEHCSPAPAWLNAGIASTLEAVPRIDDLARRTGAWYDAGRSA